MGELEPFDIGYSPAQPSFFIWADSPEDGLRYLDCNRSCKETLKLLLTFIKENNVKYVVLDSVKIVLGYDGSYTDNQFVAQFILMLKTVRVHSYWLHHLFN